MALVPFFIALFNNQMLDVRYNPTPELFFLKNEVYTYLGAFSIYTFLWMFVIDIVQDLVTHRGDREMECHTFPVVIGERNTKILIGGVVILLNVAIAYFLYSDDFLNEHIATWRYFVCGSAIPSASIFYFLFKSKTIPDYILLKRYVTVIFLIGFAFSFWIKYVVQNIISNG
jgi:4-hydroxybenzoate polyprenyltransferase